MLAENAGDNCSLARPAAVVRNAFNGSHSPPVDVLWPTAATVNDEKGRASD